MIEKLGFHREKTKNDAQFVCSVGREGPSFLQHESAHQLNVQLLLPVDFMRSVVPGDYFFALSLLCLKTVLAASIASVIGCVMPVPKNYDSYLFSGVVCAH